MQLANYKVEKITPELAQKILHNKELRKQMCNDPATLKGLPRKTVTDKITPQDAETVLNARRVAEIQNLLTRYVSGFNSLNSCIDTQGKCLRKDAAGKQKLYDEVRKAMRPFGQGQVGFHMLGSESGKAVGLPGVEQVVVEKRHNLDLATLQQEDGMSKMFINMVDAMAKEGWAKSKLRLTDAFRTELPGVFLICGRLQRMKADGSVYLDQGVIHAVVPDAGTDAGAGKTRYGIADMYFYDYDEKSKGAPPMKVLQCLATSPYYQKQAISRL
jgi:hypothetical protein